MIWTFAKKNKILLISKDSELHVKIFKNINANNINIQLYDGGPNWLELFPCISINQPQIIIIDDDYFRQNLKLIIKNIKILIPNVRIIFITSDNSIKRGREITPLGIHYYGIKPISDQEYTNLFESVHNNIKS